ncbi:pyruvate kinase [Babesia gibsoni]|uniref:Pyruvate kinase n=1 Tax=Babesia gibsoni TaxID=33632 RepID=A0AAD8PEK2_BABGI|nr:pyruvate kinase [Babesia gibsoni]
MVRLSYVSICAIVAVLADLQIVESHMLGRQWFNLQHGLAKGGFGDYRSNAIAPRQALAFLPRSSKQPERRYSYENTSYKQRNVRRNIYEVKAPVSREHAVSFFSHVLRAKINQAFAPVEIPEPPMVTLTKQVSTIGPATSNAEALKSLVDAGTDVFRLNFAHGTRTSKLKNARIIRQLELQELSGTGKSGGNVMVCHKALLGDIQGPKLRIGRFMPNVDAKGINIASSDAEYVHLKKGEYFTFDTADVKGGRTRVQFNFPDILRQLKPGNVISLDDGNMTMRVVEANAAEPSVKAMILNDGILSSRKGFAVPNIAVPVDLLSEKDVKDAIFCFAAGLDFLGVSFVQKMQDILYLKNILIDFHESHFFQQLKERMDQHNTTTLDPEVEDPEIEALLDQYYKERFLPNKSAMLRNVPPEKDIGIGIIPKIEKQPALDDINGILEVSDGLMIARGDLGVETEITNLPIIQKRLVQLCRLVYRKPVIVATQMLESMRNNPKPTRAEATDCSNAVYDGADAVMLSAESATGNYPAHTVSVQRSILYNTEHDPYFSSLQYMREMLLKGDMQTNLLNLRPSVMKDVNDLLNDDMKHAKDWNERNKGILEASDTISDTIVKEGIDALAIHTEDRGELIQWVATKRHTIPILLITRNVGLARHLQLTWGVKSHLLPDGADPCTFAQEVAAMYVGEKDKVLMIESSNNAIDSSVVFQVY